MSLLKRIEDSEGKRKPEAEPAPAPVPSQRSDWWALVRHVAAKVQARILEDPALRDKLDSIARGDWRRHR